MNRAVLLSSFAIIPLLGLPACTATDGGTTVSAEAPIATAERTRLSRADVLARYSGRTARGSGHSTTYNADGTWTNNSGQSGRWTVASDGTLVMSGDLDLRLQVFSEGNRYYHRNARTGEGGYYRV